MKYWYDIPFQDIHRLFPLPIVCTRSILSSILLHIDKLTQFYLTLSVSIDIVCICINKI